MAWYAIYEADSGRLVSIGEFELPPANLREGLLSLLLLDRPNFDTVMWDATLRIFVARPAKVLIDRLDDILTHPDAAEFMEAFNSLNATRRTRVRNFLIWLLNRHRFRNESESLRLG